MASGDTDRELESLGIIPERPPSLDEKGRKRGIFPAAVKGKWIKYREAVYAVLVLVFLVLPWTRWDNRQTILLDLANRRFYLGPITFFAHDGPLLFFVLGLAAFSIITITVFLGRVWCGWACPQTVFIEFLYRRIETWVEGNHLARRKLAEAPMDFKKFQKVALKWFLFFLLSEHIAHSLVAYFVGARELVWITTLSPSENLSLFLVVQFLAFLFLFNFGWFREQFCLIACPYGRFQSVLMDAHSMAVLYDPVRGEPRRTKGQKVAAQTSGATSTLKSNQGDCVNCFKCVAVCPTGIDIRDGIQMECLACTACMDACDEVMTKVGKPKGLIRYAVEADFLPNPPKKSWSRRGVYIFVLVMLMGGGSLALMRRQAFDVVWIRSVGSPYSVLDENHFTNQYRLHITNQSRFAISVKSLGSPEHPEIEFVSPQITEPLSPGEQKMLPVFVKVPSKLFENVKEKILWSLEFNSGELTVGDDGQREFKLKEGAPAEKAVGEILILGPGGA